MMNNDAYSPYARRAWTDEELDVLRRNCADHPVTELMAMLPGRTDSAIEMMIRKLGLPRFRPAAPPSADRREWTEAERDIVRRHYADASAKDLLAMLPGRTAGAITTRAAKLGVRKSWDAKARIRREAEGCGELWTEEELRILRERYADTGSRELMAMLPGRTYGAISEMARKMGLRKSKEGKTKSRAEAREQRRGRDAGGAGQKDPRHRL